MTFTGRSMRNNSFDSRERKEKKYWFLFFLPLNCVSSKHIRDTTSSTQQNRREASVKVEPKLPKDNFPAIPYTVRRASVGNFLLFFPLFHWKRLRPSFLTLGQPIAVRFAAALPFTIGSTNRPSHTPPHPRERERGTTESCKTCIHTNMYIYTQYTHTHIHTQTKRGWEVGGYILFGRKRSSIATLLTNRAIKNPLRSLIDRHYLARLSTQLTAPHFFSLHSVSRLWTANDLYCTSFFSSFGVKKN